ncbi:MAG: right-handed parallel beta-helix repeat-containing protein, partial [Mycobacterium sp.]|nr:right-handed parallel beta-helix repeat-containing protein [Mycobacterium sp.]
MAIDRFEATFVVDIAGNGDFTDLQSAINALPATGGKIFVKAGTYPLTSSIQITSSNVQIQGEGMGITVFVASSQMMTGSPASPALDASQLTFGTARPLTADTARGDTSLQLAAGDAASFQPNDYVLLFSNKSVDTEIPTKHAGEVKQVRPDTAASGVVLVDDQVFDTYTVADTAQLVQPTMLENITLSDFSLTTDATSSTLKLGFTHFRFIENLQIQRLEVHDAFHSGIELQSVRDAKISDCYIHHISDVQPPANERYGIVVGGASQNVSIRGCRFSHTRHSVTTGASSGTFQNGVQRNIVVSH